MNEYLKPMVWIPNPGNAGDVIIALGTLHYFQKNKFDIVLDTPYKAYQNNFLIYGGGGNLIGIWKQCEEFIINNCKHNKIVVFPHTIKDVDNLFKIKEVIENVTFYCRETVSYNYVKQFTNNVFLEHDMSFHIFPEYLKQFENNDSSGVLNCFREDLEKTDKVISKDNIDVSLMFNVPDSTSNLPTIEQISEKFFNFISNYDEIHTNRLHVGIAGSLLNKRVFLYSNSYYKNEEVFKFSIKDKFPNTRFVL